MNVREIASGLRFPEGPIAMEDGSIVLVEIARGTLSRVKPDGTVMVIATLGGGPNGAAIGPDGAVYVCNNGGFQWMERGGLLVSGHKPADYSGGRIERVNLSTGTYETLYDACDGVPLRGPNDLVFDGQGGFWFTDFAKSTHEHREWGALYYARADGSKIVRVQGQLLGPNGVGLSPDGSKVYYAETFSARLMMGEIAGPGRLQQVPGLVPRHYVGTAPGFSFLDSLAVEASGAVSVATIAQSGITTFFPDGTVAHTPIAGDPMVTNLCFGGPALRTAYVTLSGTGRLIAMDWPRSGLKLAHTA